MGVVAMLGPGDHGRPMARAEFDSAHQQEGYRYELIEGKVYVAAAPNLPHDRLWEWLYRHLHDYSQAHLNIINYVTPRAQVILPWLGLPTVPEPDLAAYHDFPHHLSLNDVSWDDISPCSSRKSYLRMTPPRTWS